VKRTAIEVLAGVLLVLVGWQLFREHEAKRDIQLQSAVLERAHDDLVSINAIYKEQTNALRTIAARPATTQTITKIVPLNLKGHVETEQVDGVTKLTLDGDPQANLQAIQEAEVDCAQKGIDLTLANGKVHVYETETIPAITAQRDNYKKLMVPHWSVTMGATYDRSGILKPAAFVGYRITNRFGISIGTAQNALFAGISWAFGKTPK
jgi:hypothetical protein